MLISIICVYNKLDQYENQLLKSVKMQQGKIEIIPIDNSCNTFHSAAEALNYGAEKAEGDIFIFAHQDIVFKQPNELNEFAKMIEKNEIGTIVGAAGVVEKQKKCYTNITSGNKVSLKKDGTIEKKLYDVASVDECLFGMKKQTWKMFRFNECLCDNWHLYAVEMCLRARKNGKRVYVYPSYVHHFSPGRISRGYMKGLIRIADHYRKDFCYIWTTCYKVSSSWLYVRALYVVWICNRIIRRRTFD